MPTDSKLRPIEELRPIEGCAEGLLSETIQCLLRPMRSTAEAYVPALLDPPLGSGCEGSSQVHQEQGAVGWSALFPQSRPPFHPRAPRIPQQTARGGCSD